MARKKIIYVMHDMGKPWLMIPVTSKQILEGNLILSEIPQHYAPHATYNNYTINFGQEDVRDDYIRVELESTPGKTHFFRVTDEHFAHVEFKAINTEDVVTLTKVIALSAITIEIGAHKTDDSREIPEIDFTTHRLNLLVYDNLESTESTLENLIDRGNVEANFVTPINEDLNPNQRIVEIKYVDIDGIESSVRFLTESEESNAETVVLRLDITTKVVHFTEVINEAPTDIIFTAAADFEDNTINPTGEKTLLGHIAAVDADAGDTHTYTLVEHGASSSFSLEGNALYFTATSEALAGISRVSAILIATDEAGASYAETFTFAVDAPFIITAVDSLTINEDSAVRFGTARIWADLGGSETATLLLSAEHGSLSYAGFRRDTSSSLTYEYFAPYIYSSGDIAIPPAGRSNGGKTLQISGVNAADLSSILSTLTYTPDADYNGDDAITIGLADGAKSLTETVAVIINPVNDAPSDIGFTSHPDYAPNFVLNFASNTLELGRFDAVNFELGRFGGIDVDSSLYDIHYTLSEDSSDGVSLFRNEYLPVGILLFNGDVTGYTDGQQITATIIATDNHDASYEKTFTFTIENPPPPNQAPTDIILISNIHHSDFTMTPDGSTLFLGILHAVDADSNVRYIRYTLSDDSDDGFSFYSEGGKLLQFNGDAANYTHGQQLSATIIATDSHDNSYSKTFTFTIDNPPNQAPTDIIFMPNSHHLDFEITPDGGNIFLGLLRAVDADSNPRYISYTISDDSDDGFNGRGRLLQFNGDAANYTHGQQLSATIIATDSHDNAYSKTFTFTIDNPSNQAPTDIIFTPNSSYVNFEVAPVGDTVSLGKIKAVDADSDYIRYTLAEDSDGGFSIHTSRLSGIRLKFDGDEADYADNEEISATVIATDRHGASYSETFTFTIDNPPNQAPTDIDLRITEESGGYVFFPTGMFIELIFIPDVGADDINEFSLLYAYSYGGFGFDTPLVFSSEYAIPFEETKILLGELLVTDSDNDDTHTFAINGDSDGRFSIEDGLLYVVYNDTSFYDYFLRNGPTQYFNGYEGAEYSAFERMIEYIDPYFAAQRNDISVTITDVEGETYTETLIDIL